MHTDEHVFDVVFTTVYSVQMKTEHIHITVVLFQERSTLFQKDKTHSEIQG